MSISGVLDRYLIRTHLAYAAQPLEKLQAKLEALQAQEVDFAALKGAQRETVIEPLWQLIGRAATATRGAMDHIDDQKHVNDVTREAVEAARGQAMTGWGELLKAVSDEPLPVQPDSSDPNAGKPFDVKVMLERVKRSAELVNIAMKSTPLGRPAPEGFSTETAAGAIDLIHQIEARPLPGQEPADDPKPATPPGDDGSQPKPAGDDGTAPKDDGTAPHPADDGANPKPADDGSAPPKPADDGSTPPKPADDGSAPPAPVAGDDQKPPVDDGAPKPPAPPADDGAPAPVTPPPADDGAPSSPPVANSDTHVVPGGQPAPNSAAAGAAAVAAANAPAPFVAAIDGVGPVNQPGAATPPPAVGGATPPPAPSAFKAVAPPPMRPGR